MARTAPVREVMRHGENGWLVDFFDPDAIASRVARVLENPGSSHALRLRAAASVHAHFSVQQGVRGYRALLGVDASHDIRMQRWKLSAEQLTT